MNMSVRCSWAVVLRSLCYLAFYDLATWIRRGSGPQVLLRLARLAERRSAMSQDSLVRSVEIGCALYVRRATCLHRSSVLSGVLRRHGVPASIVVGFRQPPFQSHAWVEVDDHVVGDHPAYKRRFQVMDVMPARGRS